MEILQAGNILPVTGNSMYNFSLDKHCLDHIFTIKAVHGGKNITL